VIPHIPTASVHQQKPIAAEEKTRAVPGRNDTGFRGQC
jgi:hypothetical protein